MMIQGYVAANPCSQAVHAILLFVEKTATIEVAATMELVHVMSIGQVQLVTLLFVLRAVKHMGHATMAHASVTRDIVVLTV